MQVTRTALRKYPANGEVLKVKNIPDDEDPEEDVNEAAVLGELELLLGPAEEEPAEEEQEPEPQ